MLSWAVLLGTFWLLWKKGRPTWTPEEARKRRSGGVEARMEPSGALGDAEGVPDVSELSEGGSGPSGNSSEAIDAEEDRRARMGNATTQNELDQGARTRLAVNPFREGAKRQPSPYSVVDGLPEGQERHTGSWDDLLPGEKDDEDDEDLGDEEDEEEGLEDEEE